jgi:1-phosphofructokinase
MILTVTPNPSIDRTITLDTPLARGTVQRVNTVTIEPGGKGVNVARTLTKAGMDAVALLPAGDHDPMVTALQAYQVPFDNVPIIGAVRTNLAVTEPDGTTTKLNEPGTMLDQTALDALTKSVVQRAADASWVVLSGSLPPGVPDDWYSAMVARLAPLPCRVAVDTSEGPLQALAQSFGAAGPDLIKPNAEELASLLALSPDLLEDAVAQGDLLPVVEGARHLISKGVRTVLVTLGAAGAVLVDGDGSWLATPPPITPRSSVGAGDSSLAGYLIADAAGAAPAQRLALAVAYGSAAAALPGTQLPGPSQLDSAAVRLQPVLTANSTR